MPPPENGARAADETPGRGTFRFLKMSFGPCSKNLDENLFWALVPVCLSAAPGWSTGRIIHKQAPPECVRVVRRATAVYYCQRPWAFEAMYLSWL